MEKSCYTTHKVVHGSIWHVFDNHGNFSHSPYNQSPLYFNSTPSLGSSWLTSFHLCEGHKFLDEPFPLPSRPLLFSSNEGAHRQRTFYRVVPPHRMYWVAIILMEQHSLLLAPFRYALNSKNFMIL